MVSGQFIVWAFLFVHSMSEHNKHHLTSHAQAPVGAWLDSPLVVRGEHVLYFAASLFGAYRNHDYWVYREVAKNAVRTLLPRPLLKLSGRDGWRPHFTSSRRVATIRSAGSYTSSPTIPAAPRSPYSTWTSHGRPQGSSSMSGQMGGRSGGCISRLGASRSTSMWLTATPG